MMGNRSSRAKSTRRQFLARAAVILPAAATFHVPHVAVGQKTDRVNPIIGEGEFQYECFHDWCTLPTGHHFGGASHGVAIDREGLVYITHHGSPGSIFVFDSGGRFVRAMGEPFRERDRGVGHGIDIREEDGEEFLYVSPDNDTYGFAKMSLGGDLVWQKDKQTVARDSGLYDRPESRFRATNLNFAPDGGYYLGDGYGSGYIHRYDRQDNYVSSFGGTGIEHGKFNTPHGQWLDDRDGTPKVVICDRANQRLQFFDLDGNYLSKLDGFLFPADIDIQGDLMLIPDLHCRLTLLNEHNQVVAQLGDDEAWRVQSLDQFTMRSQRAKWRPGKFIHPHDACFDKAGNIFVAEWVETGRVTKLRRVT